MNIITYSETLLKRLGEIEGATPEQHDLARLARAVSQVREVILDLKSFTANYVFPDSAEEIKFFKEIKPVLLSQYLFYKKLFQLRLHDSFNDPRQRINNYHVVLGKMERFAARNKPFYEYCMAGSTYLDASYFTRNGQRHPGIEKDDSFSTGFDTKVSKILAHELLKKSVMDSLRSAEQAKNVSTAGLLTWTDSKIALVELVYALHASSAVNSGRGDIKQLIGVFEELFAIDLGNYARVFAELRIRKSGQTNFIDSLKERLVQFIGSI
jgi:RteC protein